MSLRGRFLWIFAAAILVVGLGATTTAVMDLRVASLQSVDESAARLVRDVARLLSLTNDLGGSRHQRAAQQWQVVSARIGDELNTLGADGNGPLAEAMPPLRVRYDTLSTLFAQLEPSAGDWSATRYNALLLGRLSTEAQGLAEAAFALGDEARVQLARERGRLHVTLVAFSLAMLALFGTVAALVVVGVLRPVAALSRASDDFANGELAVRVSVPAGGGEMAQLGAAFNRMADGLTAQLNALRRSEQRFRLLVDGIRDCALITLDIEGRVASWNQGAERLQGYRLTDIIGQPMAHFFTPEEVAAGRPAALLEEAQAVGQVEYAGWQERRDGTRFFAEVVLTAITDSADAPLGFVKITRDASERRRLEDALHDTLTRLKLALKAAGLGIWCWRPTENRLIWDERMWTIYGLAPGVAPDRLDYGFWRLRVHPDDIDRVEHHFQRMLADDVPYDPVFRIVQPGGQVRHVQAAAVLERDSSGAVLQVVGVNRDVTDERAGADRIRRINATLEARVTERTANLRAANQELESFAYAISHDLRAPLRAISGFSQALVEDFGEGLEPQAGVYLDQILLGCRRMGDLIDGLLALSRATRGELQRDLVDLSSLAERLLAELARGEPARHVVWSVEPGLVACGDARMLEALLRNLLDNAWKYTARTADAWIRFQADADQAAPAFRVADNGAGFDMAHAEKLFQPFQRLHRQGEFAGIGIGLATVQRIVHRHGGTIRAMGVPGQGASFHFSLPGAEAHRPEQEHQVVTVSVPS